MIGIILYNVRAVTVATLLATVFSALLLSGPAVAQDASGEQQAATPIAIDAPQIDDPEPVDASDQQSGIERVDPLIAERLRNIFDQVGDLNEVEVTSQAGVVTLAGEVSNEQQAGDAVALAERVENVVLVRDQITRSRDLEGNVSPVLRKFSDDIEGVIAALPLIGFALLVFIVIALAGHWLARWSSFWRRILPNVFLAELVAQAVWIVALIVALVTALTLVGANALMGTVLGGAGIIGIAIGFAVRDTLENYVSSIMLSLRQPFRADDHVKINEYEGNVIRLTSRATVLMTLDGNHLRIPNATVFKGVILNFTRNPQRRFDFVLGIDAEDDPAQGMATGLTAIKDLPFLLDEPKPFATIEEVGDSNIVLRFFAWVDQRENDFRKSRSLAIRAAKDGLEQHGFTLPEPIYRLRFDQSSALPLKSNEPLTSKKDSSTDQGPGSGDRKGLTKDRGATLTQEDMDTQPDRHLLEQAKRERMATDEADLLDDSRPIE